MIVLPELSTAEANSAASKMAIVVSPVVAMAIAFGSMTDSVASAVTDGSSATAPQPIKHRQIVNASKKRKSFFKLERFVKRE